MARRTHSNPRGSRRSSARDNPHHYSVNGRVITFDNGRSYRINEATVAQAARYLAHDVKLAEHHGRPVPRGPQGLTPGAAAVLIHFGRKMLPKRRPAPRRPPATRRAAPAPRATRAPATRPAPAPAPAPSAPRTIPDFWDRTAEIYGGF